MKKLVICVLFLVACGSRQPRYPGALIKTHDKTYHACIIYIINGGIEARVENGKEMIIMGELTAEDDPDYYCMNDKKGPRPR